MVAQRGVLERGCREGGAIGWGAERERVRGRWLRGRGYREGAARERVQGRGSGGGAVGEGEARGVVRVWWKKRGG